jgi:hypothetical protein
VIPGYRSGNLALGGTVTSSNTDASLAENYPVRRLTNGYLSISSDCAIINYDGIFANYDIAFDSEKTINQIVLYLSQYEPEKLPLDLAADAYVGGEWKRVAEHHGVDYTGLVTLDFNFAAVNATAIRIKATNTTNVNATNFRLVEIGAFYDPNLTENDYSEIAYTDVNGSLTTNLEDLVIVRKVLLGFESGYNIDANHDDFSDIRDLMALKNSLI